MDENKEITSTRIFALITEDYEQFTLQSIDVFAHLLEICGVPATVDLAASASAAAAASAQARGTVLTQLLGTSGK